LEALVLDERRLDHVELGVESGPVIIAITSLCGSSWEQRICAKW
jgi:hypothetical protein